MAGMNSMWRKGASRHDPGQKVVLPNGEDYSYQAFVQAKARSQDGWRNGARITKYTRKTA